MAYQAGNPWLRLKPKPPQPPGVAGSTGQTSCVYSDYAEILNNGALEVPGSSDSRPQFFSTFFWLGPMGVASGAGSVALPT